jgi:beta-lactamase regulating signal transducer with metallopeptidase domain
MSEPLLRAGLSVLGDILAKSLILCLAVGMGACALRRASAAWRHLVWTLMPCGLLLLPVLTLGLPTWKLPIGRAKVLPAISSLPRNVMPLADAHDLTPTAIANSGSLKIQPPVRQAYPQSVLPATTPLSAAQRFRFIFDRPVSLSLILIGLWLVGAVAAVSQVGAGLWRVQKLRRKCVPLPTGALSQAAGDLAMEYKVGRKVTFLLAEDSLLPPMTWGFLRPVVLLPSDATAWNDDRLHAVVLHELAHIRRADWLTQTLTQCVCALYWFQPLAWWAARQQRATSERATDDRVLALGIPATDYAAHLLAIVRTLHTDSHTMRGTVAMAQRPPFESRLRAILDPRCRREAPSRTRALLALALAFGLLLPLASARVGAKQAGFTGGAGGERGASTPTRERNTDVVPLSPSRLLTPQPTRDLPQPVTTTPVGATRNASGVYTDPTSTVSLDAETEHVVWGRAIHGLSAPPNAGQTPTRVPVEPMGWGTASDGLQAGLFLETPQHSYAYGETITFVLRLRNVSAQTITLPLGIPTRRNARLHDGNLITLFSYGTEMEDLTIPAGEERDAPGQRYTFELRPPDWDGDPQANPEKPLMLLSPGHFRARMPFPGYTLTVKGKGILVDRTMTDLRSTPGTAEFELRAEPGNPDPIGTAANIAPVPNTKNNILWGKPVNGLTLGIGFATDATLFHEGEEVKLNVYLRNTANRAFAFSCMQFPEIDDDPIVTGGKRNPFIQLLKEVKGVFSHDMSPMLPMTLQPGETQQVALPHFTLLRDGRPYRHTEAVLIAGPGKYHLTFQREVRLRNNTAVSLIVVTAPLAFEIR